MPVIRHAQSRRTETPNAVMTTLASPAQGGAGHSLWRVDMRPGATGALHAFDAEQVWTVVEGGATVELDGEALSVVPGDTVVMPAAAPRRVYADSETGFAGVVAAPPGSSASAPTARAGPSRPGRFRRTAGRLPRTLKVQDRALTAAASDVDLGRQAGPADLLGQMSHVVEEEQGGGPSGGVPDDGQGGVGVIEAHPAPLRCVEGVTDEPADEEGVGDDQLVAWLVTVDASPCRVR